MKKSAIGYARVSSKDRKKDRSASLGTQGDNIGLCCEVMDRHLIGVFEDDGHSAKSFDRPDWKKLEVFVQAHHKEIDMLVVDTFDRFSRNLIEGLEMMQRLEKKYSITVVSATEPITAHPDHPDYFTQRAKYLLEAESERHKIRFRTGRGVWKANKEGRHLGHAPWAYYKKDGKLYPDPKLAPFVAEAFRMFITGSEKTQILSYLRSKGYSNSGKVAVNRLLENPAYAGMIRVKEFYGQPSHLVDGKHASIISKSTYYRAQDLLTGKTFTRLKINDDVPLRGVLLCHCGKKLTAGNTKGRHGGYFWYYKCTDHKETNINAKRIHEQMGELMAGLSLPALYIDEIRRRLNERLMDAEGDHQADLAQKQKDLVDLDRKLQGIHEKFIDDALDKTTYHQYRDRYIKDRNLLAAEIDEASTPVNNNFVQVEQHIAKLTDMGAVYHRLNTIQKQSLIAWCFNSQLSWSNGAYRTPDVQPLFRQNVLKMNKKGLLFLEQPTEENRVLNSSSARGATVEPLIELLTLISDIKNAS